MRIAHTVSSLRGILSLIISLLLAIVIAVTYLPMSPYWFLSIVAILLIATVRYSWRENCLFLLINFAVLCVLMGVFLLLPDLLLIKIIYFLIFSVIALTMAESFKTYQWFVVANLVLFLVFILLPETHVAYLQFSLCLSAASGLILLVQASNFLFANRYDEKLLLKTIFATFTTLSRDIFASFTRLEYRDNLYLFEHRIHRQQVKLQQALLALNKDLQKPNSFYRLQPDLMRNLLDLYNLLMEAALLRHRIKDYTVFEMSLQDLEHIASELKQVFLFLQQKVAKPTITINCSALQISIEQYEVMYEQVLAVAAKEPFSLVLFTQSLRNLMQKIEQVAACLNYGK